MPPPTSLPPLPEWVRKRDGRLVPFEADKISQALFAATERLGRPDAFTARELTDGVLHFLAAEAVGTTPTTAQVAELVVKVVRELGHPVLAQAFADGAADKSRAVAVTDPTPAPLPLTPAEVSAAPHSRALSGRIGDAFLCEYALGQVFARDLASAHREGLISLGGLPSPWELAGVVLGPATAGQLVEAMEAARVQAGMCLVIDSPERTLADGGSVAAYVRELGIGLRATGLRAVVNLNSATPPSWAGELAEGPLFGGRQPTTAPETATGLAEELLARLLADAQGRLRVDWHLGERDFRPGGRDRLPRLARHALQGAPLAFAFDRPRRAVPLAQGIDRQHPAVLLPVGLHLSRLAEQMRRTSVAADAEVFLRKLGSLARLALSAGVQKRTFLRRHPRAWPAFLLDRARLLVVPVGLEAVVDLFTGRRTEAGGPALDLARRIVQRLREVLTDDGQASHLTSCLDGSFPPDLGDEAGAAAGMLGDPAALPKDQLKAAAVLHAGHAAGTATLWLRKEHMPTPDEFAELLYWAWRHSEIARLRCAVIGPRQQPLAAWAEPATESRE